MHYFPKVLYYFSLASSQPFNTHPYISFSFSSCCWKREKIVSSSTWEEKKKKTLPSTLMDICKSVENHPEKIWPSKTSKYLDPWWSLGITIKLFQFLCSILKKIQSVHQMNTLFLQKWSNPKPMSRLREVFLIISPFFGSSSLAFRRILKLKWIISFCPGVRLHEEEAWHDKWLLEQSRVKYEVLAGLVDELFIASFLCEGKKYLCEIIFS